MSSSAPHRLIPILLLCLLTLVMLSGCGNENPAQVRDFRIKYFRHKLYDVHFSDDRNGWICGDYGLIWKTTDGGNTWAPLTSGTILPLRGLSFSDAQNGWAVGDQGTILHTKDAGATWKRQEAGTSEHFLDVAFLDDRTGFAIGVFATLLQTEDGGEHWENISERVKEKEKEFQFFIDEEGTTKEDEEALTEGEIDVSEEGMPVLEPLLNRIFFLDKAQGWIVAEEGNIFHTKDRGKSWAKQDSGAVADLFSVYFKNPEEGWITGLNGLLLHTMDGGEHWESQPCPVNETLFSIVVTEKRGYAVGNAASIITTTDGGKTWEPFALENIVLYSWLRDLKYVEKKFIAIGGLGTILINDTSGEDWRQVL